ncbi:hypothetical protein [Enterovibrio paralichthyis]|uniref:hypothetical protein n=1 Tax=Enterovibrio paralichthyis TaxID=2853805 RepID=UPI001C45D0F9|nr:hypothetical protein [Enterovibrio paralichthyis]MBV7299286.1 hypothetical protein [Enterovibrio paralichthyis]
MVKIVFVIGLIIIGGLAMKFLDEKSQKKVVIGVGVLAAIAILSLIITELMR